MWRLASTLVLLVVSLISADPQQGYEYLPPSITFDPAGPCLDIISTSIKQNVIPTTVLQVDTKYTTTTVYSQRVVPTTLYKTQYKQSVAYQTSYVQRDTQVVKEQVVTSTQQARPVVKTSYKTSVRVVPQVSYVVKEQVKTQVVPVEKLNVRYETRYTNQVRYQTVPVQQTSVVRVPGRIVYSTVYKNQIQTSVVQKSQAAKTNYVTTTRVQNSVQTQTIPSPPVVQTKYVQSQRVVPTTVLNSRYETVYVTRTAYVTKIQYQTQTKVQTQYVPQEVLVTVDAPREVLKTEYRTQVLPTTSYQTRYVTETRQGYPVQRTHTAYASSIVRVPGQDRVVTKQVIQTQNRQQVVYKTQNVQRQVSVTRTVTAPCEQKSGYSYPEPQVAFNF